MGLIALLAPMLLKIIEQILPDPVAQAAAKLQIQQALNQALALQLDADAKTIASQATTVAAEIQGQSAMQRNWRPMLMFLFMAIIGNNYILYPFLHAFFPNFIMLPVPENMWSLLEICVGGYVGGRSLEKVATSVFNDGKFFDVFRKEAGPMSQAQVNAMNDALKAAKEQ